MHTMYIAHMSTSPCRSPFSTSRSPWCICRRNIYLAPFQVLLLSLWQLLTDRLENNPIVYPQFFGAMRKTENIMDIYMSLSQKSLWYSWAAWCKKKGARKKNLRKDESFHWLLHHGVTEQLSKACQKLSRKVCFIEEGILKSKILRHSSNYFLDYLMNFYSSLKVQLKSGLLFGYHRPLWVAWHLAGTGGKGNSSEPSLGQIVTVS
jgi:hypothetical protein